MRTFLGILCLMAAFEIIFAILASAHGITTTLIGMGISLLIACLVYLGAILI